MADGLSRLSDVDLKHLASALKSGRVSAPYSSFQLQWMSSSVASDIITCLKHLAGDGFTESQIATMIDLLLRDRLEGARSEPPIDLVTSGPEGPGITNRDTAVVVRELFTHAQTSVLVVGYAVYQGQAVFEALARRMAENPDLEVKLFLNIARSDHDKSPASVIVSQFRQRFQEKQWPKGCPLPEVYYDPRSVAENKRSSLHAKCVVVDAEHVFVSSANFTEAAQQRNIEVGLKIESPWLAQRLARHFQLLREHSLAVRAF